MRLTHLPIALSLAVRVALPGVASGAERPAGSSVDYVEVSRALTEIDAADRRGDLGDELRWAEAAERAPRDVVAQFLAVAAQPAAEDRWSAYRDLSLQFSRSPLPWVGMARTYIAWRTWDQAEKAIAAALERDPSCFLAVRLRAQLRALRGRPDEARADFQAVLQADPKNPEAHYGLARLAKARGDLEAAHDEAAAALEEARSIPGAWEVLADIAGEIGEPGAAADFWRGAIAQAPRDRAARVALARILTAQGDARGAEQQWQAALELKEDAEALSALAEAARAAGDAEVEQRALERLSRLRPALAEWRRMAEIRMAARDLDGAEKAYRRVLDAEPHDERAALGLAHVHLARGESTHAVEDLRAAGAAGKPELAALEGRLNLERLSGPDLAALQKAAQALVDRTYRAKLADAPSLSGNVRVRVTVDAAGAATQVEVLEDSVHDEDVRACAYWNLRDAAYPPDQPGRYTFSFSFRR